MPIAIVYRTMSSSFRWKVANNRTLPLENNGNKRPSCR